ncbi:MAG: 3-phosphoglycerate dehydrogenase [Bacteroidetes bacterium GWF2_42_66]|nr:MAG: 3-phosphoglycerate dehydrogenase [Bacteroidetes bacterium GWA2_42_15]OFX97338.1 MAG: 3-phosphoglycerate dehydrogenase [Bacteroidetes bacterium GWE2_42_39]OFY39975.1 MAG: 3-phosphoglycerate dehydrogenase [Bacteroidetes bacterium GWF2_42_66]HAZ03502.1 3-phosphoglycerate dehydrogenase [Marinilabiliales bacterium]HBL78169.1 3-phosphoglycerate dehydrogenase [Prolixibacteraceae bacterium]
MFKIQTLNKIDSEGLKLFLADKYEIAGDMANPDAIVVRSAAMHDMEMPSSLKAIARAGAGVNNIPIEKCTEKGIVVFNTPGANANAVKELVIAGMLLSSRGIAPSIEWAKTLIGKGSEVPALIEDGKKNYGGTEIKGKTLAIIGLGAIGVLIANAAQALEMDVVGYDPYISVTQAWHLSRNVKKAESIESLLSNADFVSINVPQTPETKGYINKNTIKMMKDGVKILNFARGGLVNNKDIKEALESGKVSCYVTDFPDEEVLMMKNVVAIPHLGASTEESETNCAIMAVEQVRNYLEKGNIVNSVNFPTAEMDRNGGARILIANKNVPNMVGQITSKLASEGINIANMLNKNKSDIAYNIIDIDGADPSDTLVEKLLSIDGVFMARILHSK